MMHHLFNLLTRCPLSPFDKPDFNHDDLADRLLRKDFLFSESLFLSQTFVN